MFEASHLRYSECAKILVFLVVKANGLHHPHRRHMIYTDVKARSDFAFTTEKISAQLQYMSKQTNSYTANNPPPPTSSKSFKKETNRPFKKFIILIDTQTYD